MTRQPGVRAGDGKLAICKCCINDISAGFFAEHPEFMREQADV